MHPQHFPGHVSVYGNCRRSAMSRIGVPSSGVPRSTAQACIFGIPVKLASRIFASSRDGRKGGRSRGLISILILVVIT
jgi:hypothetical protein